MLTILTALYLKANAYAVGLHKLLGSHPLLALPCWTLGSTSIHLTLAVWTTTTLGGFQPLWYLSTLYACHLPNSPAVAVAGARPKKKTQQFRHESADADTLTKSCPSRCSGFRWTLHIIFFGRAPAWAVTDDGSYARPCFAGANASLTRSYPHSGAAIAAWVATLNE